MNRDKSLLTDEDILPFLKFICGKRQEYFVCLSLDSGQKLIARRTVTIGLLDTTLVHPREVFAGPLVDRAASVIVSHNHPSGDASPSKHDIEVTQQLIAAAQLLGIRLRNHLIVTKDEHYSFVANGLIESFPILMGPPPRVKDCSVDPSSLLR
jgi:DNA repair protein RadC